MHQLGQRVAVRAGLAILSVAVTLSTVERILQWRESSQSGVNLQQLTGSNVDSLIHRQANDPVRVRFFNGCFLDHTLLHQDPVLGYVNVPNSDGYSIRIYGRTNLVVRQTFDLSQLRQPGVRVDVAPFHINALGNRGAESDFAKPADTTRLVFLGDSVTFGYYVRDEEAYPAVVAARWQASSSSSRHVEEINAGVSGLNVDQIFCHLRERALSWSPDAVIWGFYVNDLVEQEADVLFPVRRLGGWTCLDETALGRLIERCLLASRWGFSLAVDGQHPVNQTVEQAWRHAERLVEESHRLLEARGATLILVAIPSAIQLGRPWTRCSYQERLRRLCARHDIGFVDPLPLLESASPATNLYVSGDLIHPNAQGHAVIASAIVETLAAHPLQ